MNAKGQGVGTSQTGGRLVVPGAIPGECVEVIKRRKRCPVLRILEPSPDRVGPRCIHFGQCGGCAWQHVEYEHQLHLKRETVLTEFRQKGIDLSHLSVHIEPSEPFYYRHRMDFVWWRDGRFGLRRRDDWRSIVNLDECHLLPAHVFQIAAEVHRRVQADGLPLWDSLQKRPGMRYLVIRTAHFTGETMLAFVSDALPLPPALWEGLDGVTSVYQLLNENLESDLSDGIPHHLAGNETIQEEMLSRRFHIGPNTFFQPNPAMAACLVDCLRGWMRQGEKPRKKMMDLYCGVGLFSILLGDLFEEVLGVEVSEPSICLAIRNAGKGKYRFLHSDAASLPPEVWNDVDVLLVDPPRDGLHPKALQAVRAAAPAEVLYVSCNPRRGIEDISALLNAFTIRQVQLFDQFPETPHVEMAVHLVRREA